MEWEEFSHDLRHYIQAAGEQARAEPAEASQEPARIPREEPQKGRQEQQETQRGSQEQPGARADKLQWCTVGKGFLAARPVPQDAGQIKEWDATVVVTLLRPHEKVEAVQSACENAGCKWLWAPVEAISNCKKPVSPEDLQSLMKAGDVLRLCESGERVVVHCAAGCHRTGTFCYLVLRRAGKSCEEALSAIRQTRELTWKEMTEHTKKRPQGLHRKAEDICQRLWQIEAGQADVGTKDKRGLRGRLLDGME
eukprot:TRINITY_DN65156_c0_g1_i1.p1 TRINITY_DN65156_c0_g1~~TRINITY_DN65156_c0_g1_i1.p1  ORF type:complete len:266 (-),score=63.72 TRINITY_DN65156_c0_g1_i1:66-821(-)